MIDLPKFMEPLRRLGDGFPEEAVRETLRRKDETVPVLLHCLEEVARSPESEEWEDDFILLEFAMYLLAEWRESRALDPILRIARHPRVDALFGDLTTEGLPSILASVCEEDPRRLIPLLGDRDADEFARGAVLAAWGSLMEAGVLPRSDLLGLLMEAHANWCGERPSFVWDGWISLVADLRLPELLSVVEELYEKGFADPGFQTLEQVRQAARRGPKTEIQWKQGYRLIESTIDEMEW